MLVKPKVTFIDSVLPTRPDAEACYKRLNLSLLRLEGRPRLRKW